MIRDGCEIRDVVEDGGAVWTQDGGVDGTRRKSETWVRTGVDKGVDGRWRGTRLGVDGCGWGCGWKTEGSETGCDAVLTGVWMEDGGERD